MEREEVTVRRAPAILPAKRTNGSAEPRGRARRRSGVGEGDVERRIMRELHDTVKQNLCGATMMIEACLEAQKEDPSLVRKLLGRALELSREAEHQLSQPLEELGLSCPEGLAPTTFLRERFKRLGRDFGIETHESLRAPLETLSRTRVAVAHRVCIEAA